MRKNAQTWSERAAENEREKEEMKAPCHPFGIIHPNLFPPGLSKPIKADPFQQTE
jgi:hypothetical protein